MATNTAARGVLATAGAAWLTAVALTFTPLDRDLEHGALDRLGAHPWLVLTLTAGWGLMVLAMMLPGTLPLVAAAPARPRGTAAVLAGYLLVWLAAGLVLHLGDLGVHWLVHHWGWLGANTWAISAVTLAAAGLYQFTATKAGALDRCRAPDVDGLDGGIEVGVGHGLHCLVCCWPLMLVMFSVGLASLAWMFALTVVMAAEKLTPVGHRASRMAGAWLLVAAGATVLAG